MRCFEDKRNNPFQFRHLSLCHGLSDLARVPSPKVVLASQPDLECGFSRDLFIQWCEDPKNSIILTYRTTPGTLARFLIDNPAEKVTEIEVSACMRTLSSHCFEYIIKLKDFYQNNSREPLIAQMSELLSWQSSFLNPSMEPSGTTPDGMHMHWVLLSLLKSCSASFP